MDRDAGTRIRVSLRAEPEPTPEREEIPRIVRLLALAHRWHRQLDEGVYESQGEIASITGLTPASISQIMGLAWLSPRIQAEIASGSPGRARRRELLAHLDVQRHQLLTATCVPVWQQQLASRWETNGSNTGADPTMPDS